jgi:hypothetical protein
MWLQAIPRWWKSGANIELCGSRKACTHGIPEINQMSSFQNVSDLQAIERHPGYDAANNPQLLTVADLMPVGITWRSNGTPRIIRNQSGVDGRLLNDLSGIAVVEAPYDATGNRAYIVNADGSVRAEINSQTKFGHAIFYDVHYVNDTLAFLAVASGRDVRIDVSEIDGTLTGITETR